MVGAEVMSTPALTQTAPETIEIAAGTLMFKELSRFPMSHRAEGRGKWSVEAEWIYHQGWGASAPYRGHACETLG